LADGELDRFEPVLPPAVDRALLATVDRQAHVLGDMHPPPMRGHEQDSDHGENDIEGAAAIEKRLPSAVEQDRPTTDQGGTGQERPRRNQPVVLVSRERGFNVLLSIGQIDEILVQQPPVSSDPEERDHALAAVTHRLILGAVL
jgi:hypothetical protein